MILLGSLLVLGVAGLAFAAFANNDGLFTAPAGAVEMFGYRATRAGRRTTARARTSSGGGDSRALTADR
jgi:hypothetical protein